jgi:lincosamide nucleotidyltransferase A/C/D/E
MTEQQVLSLYEGLLAEGIAIWIDGGWCVDALLGARTREHANLDVAAHRRA